MTNAALVLTAFRSYAIRLFASYYGINPAQARVEKETLGTPCLELAQLVYQVFGNKGRCSVRLLLWTGGTAAGMKAGEIKFPTTWSLEGVAFHNDDRPGWSNLTQGNQLDRHVPRVECPIALFAHGPIQGTAYRVLVEDDTIVTLSKPATEPLETFAFGDLCDLVATLNSQGDNLDHPLTTRKPKRNIGFFPERARGRRARPIEQFGLDELGE